MINREHGALTLRTLQTLAEVATEHNSTLVLPIPFDMLDDVRGHTDAAPPPPPLAASGHTDAAPPALAAPIENGR